MIDNCISYVASFFNTNNVDAAHGYSHAISVYHNAIDGCNDIKLEGQQRENVLLAALLHDVDDKKLFNTKDHANARAILAQLNVDVDSTNTIIEIISLVSCSDNKDSDAPLWKLIVRISDRFEAIGDIGIQRCYEYNIAFNQPLYLDSTPRVTTVKELCEVATPQRYASYNGKSVSMIDHFYDKLLHIGIDTRLPSLHTRSIDRQAAMIKFVLNFGKNGFDYNYFKNTQYQQY